MFRIGQGFDIHRLETQSTHEGIILGGVSIPFEKSIVAHSDGDVLIHAVIDALFGAAGLGDIGQHYPDTSSVYKGCDSRTLLKDAIAKVTAKGYELINLDSTIIAQAPKLAPHLPQMQENLSTDLQISINQINIKAKTHEGLDALGKKEGIAAQVVVLLKQKEEII
jgi:2-C-methyl-D-erythritol 2,4-cyclodiphosphate synthase